MFFLPWQMIFETLKKVLNALAAMINAQVCPSPPSRPARETGHDLRWFGLDAGCASLYFPRTKRFYCWLPSVRKSETQVFPTFLFAGCRQRERRFYRV
jgi:hypothetical protein